MTQFRPFGDAKDWARRIVWRHQHGEHIKIYVLKLAYEALGLAQPGMKAPHGNAARQNSHEASHA